MTDVPDLARAAHESSAIVIGGGLSGLVAAHSFAQIGMPVTLVEARSELGGALRTASLAGHPADLGPVAFPAATGFMDVLRAVGLGEATIPQAQAERTTVLGGDIRPLPAGIVGIPANPFDPKAVAIIGWRGAWRAYLDRLRPVLTIGNAPVLGPLVRSRMGRAVSERLVGPVARTAFGSSVDELDVDAVAPKLNAALTRTGSLSGGVADVLSDAGPALRLMRDGFVSLTEALHERVNDLGGTVLLATQATTIARTSTGFAVTMTSADDDGETTTETLTSDIVVIATDEAPARALLAQVGAVIPGETLTRPAVTVALAVDAAGVPDIGAGICTQLDEPAVWGIDDLSAQHGETGDIRVLRVRLSPVAAERTDDEAVDIAVSEASRLLGVRLRVRDSAMARTAAAASGARVGAQTREDDVRAQVSEIPGLGVVGAWVAGSGVVPVATDAAATAEALRRTALFG